MRGGGATGGERSTCLMEGGELFFPAGALEGLIDCPAVGFPPTDSPDEAGERDGEFTHSWSLLPGAIVG